MSNATTPAQKTPLNQNFCEACSIGTLPLLMEDIQELSLELSPHWTIEDNKKMMRHFKFKDFKTALAFVNLVGELAEREGHHPDIALSWGSVTITLLTHKIKGLSLYDFILASKIDQLPL